MFNKLRYKLRSWSYPAATNTELILDRRRIYILPSRSGVIFLLLLLSIFITSINYGINLGYALNFILISCGWLGIVFTFKNLAGLGLKASASRAVFAGEFAHFSVHLNNHSGQPRYAVAIGFHPTALETVDIPEHSSHHLTLTIATKQRGWMSCPRIQLQTTFPFGLLKAWSYWQTAQQVLVYPAPEFDPPPLPFAAEGHSGTGLAIGSEEFSGVRNYQTGDSLKQLAWRQMARQSAGSNELLLSKHFEGGQRLVCVLDFSQLPLQLSTEQKLSRLCAWVLMAEEQHVSYSLKLGSFHVPQNSGEDHQRSCLTALALFGEKNE